MGQSSKIPLVITKNSFSITLKGKTAEALLQQPRPILWNNDGMYCWISLIRIKNQVRRINDTITHAKANDQLYEPIFMLTWDGRTHHYSEEMAQAIELMSQEKTENEKLRKKVDDAQTQTMIGQTHVCEKDKEYFRAAFSALMSQQSNNNSSDSADPSNDKSNT